MESSVQRFVQGVDAKRALAHAEWLCTHAPYRQGGSDREHRAAHYFADQLKAYGYDVQMLEFMAYMGFPGNGKLEVLGAEPFEIPVSVFAHSTGTPAEGVETELVFCEHGAEQDYAGNNVAGKVILTRLSFTPPRPEKARLAAVNGAAGILMMHFLSGEYDNLPEGAVKSVWGNPTDETFGPMQTMVPAGGIRKADGERLMALLQQGPVRVRLTVEAERRWAKLLMPIGFLPGSVEREQFTLLAGHMDSWSGGATDNAVADGSVLELARAIAQQRSELRRGVLVTFWPGHEQGIMEGSTYFVDALWDRLDQHCTLYLNLDEMGKKGTKLIRSWGSPEAAVLAQRAMHDSLGLKDVPVRDLIKQGDQSFFGIGIPSVWINSGPDDQQLKDWQGAEFGWWWHTCSDTMDKVDPDILHNELQANAHVLWELSTTPVLPFRFTAMAERIARRLAELQEQAGAHLDLSAPVSWAAELQRAAAALDAASDAGQETNQAQIDVSRALHSVTDSVIGRWEQDSYGLSALRTYLPGLRDVQNLSALAGSEQYHLVQTRLLRERNRVRDALRQACRAIEANGVVR